MRSRSLLAPAIAAAALAACAQQPAPMAPGDSAIDFAAGGGIRDWHAADAQGIYVRDSANRWYYARFTAPCPGVLSDPRIEFDTDVVGRFDRFSRVITQTMTCAVDSLQPTVAPDAKGGPPSQS